LLRLFGVAVEIAPVAIQIVDTDRGHAALQPPHDGRPFVGREVETGALPDALQEGTQLVIAIRGRQHIGAREQIDQEGADCLQVDDDVDRRGGNGQRHAREASGLRVLDHHGAAVGLDGLRADRAVAAGAGQHDGDQPIAEGAGGSRQEAVDRGCWLAVEVR
jgi:hypothetical protein